MRALTVVNPQNFSAAGNTNSTPVNASGAREVVFVLATGAITSGTVQISAVQESADGSTWTAVPPERIKGALAQNVAAGKAAKVAVIDPDEQVRCVVTTAGATVNLTAGVVAVIRAPVVEYADLRPAIE